MHKVSVVIPCYRQAEFLEEAIDSVLGQSYPEHEIVVVDDASPDHTSTVAKRYPNVRYVRQERRGGVSLARNRGLQETTGTYVVFLDADDRLLPDHFATSMAAFEQHPEAAFVCGDYRWFGTEETEESWHHHRCPPSPDHYATLLRFNFIGPPVVVMFRRDKVLLAGGFATGIDRSEDQDLYLRLARIAPISCHHGTVAEYRRHPSQASKDWAAMLKAAIRMLRRQRPFIRANRHYREAYIEGLRFRRQLYGKLAYWQGVTALQAGDWPCAIECLWALVRYDPKALMPASQRILRCQAVVTSRLLELLSSPPTRP
jgi:glycosyltransferase involved in cell wall biosynthesis